MATFSSGLSFTDSGYQALFRQQPRTSASSLDDPRGLLRSGMTPVKSISYRVFAESDNFIQLTTPLDSFVTSGRADVVLGSSRVWASVVAFEGKDVIDLPTTGLQTIGDDVVVPHHIFRVLHAGAGKFIRTPEETVQQRSIDEFLDPSDDNLSLGTAPTADAPADLKRLLQMGQSWRSTDTASKTIRTRGGAKFVSYVAMTRPVFRDVVYQRVSFSSTVILGNGSLIPIDTAPQNLDFFVIRYAFVNVAPEGEDARYQWRMSESFHTKATKPVEKASAGVLSGLSKDELTREQLSDTQRHYVYNINEPGDDLETRDPFIPAKTPHSPAAARDRMDPNSFAYDKNFFAQVVDYEGFYLAPGGAEEVYSVGISAANHILPAAAYTSPRINVDMGPTGRLGLEYPAHQPQFLSILTPPATTILLARTVESTFGITAIQDCCVNGSTVFDVVDSPAGAMATERTYDDTFWSKTDKDALPETNLKQFMLAEYPHVSAGRPVFSPEPSLIPLGEGGSMPSNRFATMLILDVDKSSNQGMFSLHPGAEPGTEPVFEAYHPDNTSSDAVTSPTFVMGVPGITFQSEAAGGGFRLKEAWGLEKDAVILEAMVGDPTSSDQTLVQFSQVKEEKFPILASNISAEVDCTSGLTFLATENGERIDLGVRENSFLPFGLLRDVVLRIPDDDSKASSDSTSPTLPAASLPYLVNDPQTHSLLLFYVYKGNVLVKRIPIESLHAGAAFAPLRQYSLEEEMKIVRMIHDIVPSVVLDPTGGDGNGLLADFTQNRVKVIPSGGTVVSPAKAISQYSAFIDKTGALFVFAQIEDRIVVRRSNDLGDSWKNVLPEAFSFIPGPQTDERIDGTAPYCDYDWATDNVLMFFFHEKCLLFNKMPTSALMGTPEEAASLLSNLRPMVVVGRPTKEMTDRGITTASSVEDIKNGEVPPSLTPHRVAAIMTAEGYHRLFYKDELKKLKSIVSIDQGGTWFTERQAMERAS